MKYICQVCGYEYDEELGDPDNGIAPGTAASAKTNLRRNKPALSYGNNTKSGVTDMVTPLFS